MPPVPPVTPVPPVGPRLIGVRLTVLSVVKVKPCVSDAVCWVPKFPVSLILLFDGGRGGRLPPITKLPSLMALHRVALEFGRQFGKDGSSDAGFSQPTCNVKPVPVADEFWIVPVSVVEPGVNGLGPVKV